MSTCSMSSFSWHNLTMSRVDRQLNSALDWCSRWPITTAQPRKVPEAFLKNRVEKRTRKIWTVHVSCTWIQLALGESAGNWFAMWSIPDEVAIPWQQKSKRKKKYIYINKIAWVQVEPTATPDPGHSHLSNAPQNAAQHLEHTPVMMKHEQTADVPQNMH